MIHWIVIAVVHLLLVAIVVSLLLYPIWRARRDTQKPPRQITVPKRQDTPR